MILNVLADANSTTDVAAIVNAVLNTLQTVALAFIAARWRPH